MNWTGTAEVTAGDVVILVGTAKGLFLFHGGADRDTFELNGPHFPGESIGAAAYDDRAGRRRLLVGAQSSHWGAVVRHSDDFGATWTNPTEGNIRFPSDAGASLTRVWQLTPAGADQPEVVYAGVEPAALFRSKDAGASFELVSGLWEHPHRPQWEPGGGGLCLHTILLDPADPGRVLIAISTGGVYQSKDGGDTWAPHNVGVRAVFLPNQYPEFGQCVHKVAAAGGHLERLYLQNHWGLYRSDDGGERWEDIANGVPSDFGFPMVAHPRDPDTAYAIPLVSDEFRCTPEGKARVYRTRDAGGSWEPRGAGLPQRHAYLTVLRDAFSGDTCDPFGLYFGTRTGELFASRDEGASWQEVASHLPPVLCVRAAVIA